MSLATRVSEELGERGPGTHQSLCGYQIRYHTSDSIFTGAMFNLPNTNYLPVAILLI